MEGKVHQDLLSNKKLNLAAYKLQTDRTETHKAQPQMQIPLKCMEQLWDLEYSRLSSPINAK